MESNGVRDYIGPPLCAVLILAHCDCIRAASRGPRVTQLDPECVQFDIGVRLVVGKFGT